jgi:DUF4097 and DUF4098 domain-containing protein YvlB
MYMTPTMSRTEADFQRTLSVAGPVILEASLRCGRIRVRRGEDHHVTVYGIVRAHPSMFSWIHPEPHADVIAADPPVKQDGNTIRIGDMADRWLLRRVSLFIEITAPAGTSLRALGDAADLRVEGIHGPVECETDSGEIVIADIRERVSATSDSGAISVQNIAGPIDVETDSGDIEALEIAGGIDAHSDSGRVRLSQTIAAPVYAQTDSGRVVVKLAPEAGYSIRVRTDCGQIEIPELTTTRGSGRETEGVIRGGGSIVAVETDSGDIEIV